MTLQQLLFKIQPEAFAAYWFVVACMIAVNFVNVSEQCAAQIAGKGTRFCIFYRNELVHHQAHACEKASWYRLTTTPGTSIPARESTLSWGERRRVTAGGARDVQNLKTRHSMLFWAIKGLDRWCWKYRPKRSGFQLRGHVDAYFSMHKRPWQIACLAWPPFPVIIQQNPPTVRSTRNPAWRSFTSNHRMLANSWQCNEDTWGWGHWNHLKCKSKLVNCYTWASRLTGSCRWADVLQLSWLVVTAELIKCSWTDWSM